MYELDKLGLVETTSPISNLKTLDTLALSFRLPLPKSDKTITIDKTDSLNELILPLLLRYYTKVTGNVNLLTNSDWLVDLLNSENIKENELGLALFQEVLKLVNDSDSLTATKDNKLANLINKHLRYKVTKAGLKNRIANIIHTCSKDVNNMESSTQPMDSGYINDLILECENESGKSGKKLYIITSPVSKYLMQYENSVGKGNVGIAANGVKADAALQQYFNMIYRNWNGIAPLDLRYTLKIPIEIYHEDGSIVTSKNFVKLGNTVLDQDFTEGLKKFKQLYSSVGDELLQESDYQFIQYLNQHNAFPKTAEYYYKSGKDWIEKTLFKELETLYNLFKEQNGEVIDRDSYLNFLYYRTQFEHNVADNLSIFISLATD